MSYYMGDYYRGDPGIGSFFAGLAKKAVGFIPGIGPALSAVLPGGAKSAGAITKIGSAAKGVMVKHPVLSAAGAAGAIGVMGAGAEKVLTMGAGGACPKGHHISHSKHAKHFGQCVKNRRMNSCNPRALRRAVRRLHSFARHYRRTVGFVTPHPKKGRMYFKSKRKR